MKVSGEGKFEVSRPAHEISESKFGQRKSLWVESGGAASSLIGPGLARAKSPLVARAESPVSASMSRDSKF